MPITAEMWADDHPFESLYKVERRIREFLAENPDKGYTALEIYDIVVPREHDVPRNEGLEPVARILSQMYCTGQVNTVRLDGGITNVANTRYFRHRSGTKPVFEGPTPDDDDFPDCRGSTERKPNHDTIGRG